MTTPGVSLDRPWLTFDLGRDMRALSWALNRPGFVTVRRIVWREVRNADLPPELDVQDWLKERLHERGETDSIAFLTSRNIERYQTCHIAVGSTSATAVATVGLSNAERIGSRRHTGSATLGTINVALKLGSDLSDTGLIEALSIAAAARTAAILDAGIRVGSGRATGTGTDCIAIAATQGPTDYAGMHTEIGEAIGRVVYQAVRTGADAWLIEQKAHPSTF